MVKYYITGDGLVKEKYMEDTILYDISLLLAFFP
jgi:hypothetical protein